jgi:pyruvate dehydrogenase E2 component (dihydrolipoamide acetyltransferase)
LGYATEEGTILSWLKAPGDPVRPGDELVEIVSEKAVSVVVAGQGGVLAAIYALPGAIVAEGETIGWIGAPGEHPPQHDCALRGWDDQIAPPPPGLEARIAPRAPARAATPPEVAASPASVRTPGKPGRRAREIVKGQLRRVTGQRMAHSWQAPKVDLFTDVDFSRVLAHRQALKAMGREPPSYNIYIAHAAAQAITRFPELNAHWIDGKLVPLEAVHIGVAVALDRSLVTVSMKDVGGLGLEALQARFKALIRKAATMSLSREELYGSSLTITNLGEFEVTGFTAVLNPPELFILAIGMLRERVVPRDGGFAAVPFSTFCLSFDHRGVDGAPASRLLREIKHILERYGEE